MSNAKKIAFAAAALTVIATVAAFGISALSYAADEHAVNWYRCVLNATVWFLIVGGVTGVLGAAIAWPIDE